MLAKVKKAAASPLGVTLVPGGANVAVWSAHATQIFFCTFDEHDHETSRVALTQRVGDVHFDFVNGVGSGTRYGLRAQGPWAPEQGVLFDDSKVLLDPYAFHLSGSFSYSYHLGERHYDTAALVAKAVVMPAPEDVVLKPASEPQFIYELQVKSFTKLHPDVPVAQRGTVAALKHPSIIAHLKSIGVDTIELMPITAWIDERHLAALELSNAWGYNPVSFFAPDPRLAPGGLEEIRDTVAELHVHGFQVILDLVFNHTGESDVFGPSVSFRGLDHSSYYRLYNGQLANDAGCGNTVALDKPHNVQLVAAALRHWVLKCGIDGFRFDLATIMGRRDDGFDSYAPLLLAIESDPILSTRIMIAEPWDVGPGGYQLGNFPPRWYEWNDRYRDDVRRFWRGDDYSANALATRITGSSDFFQRKNRATKSINFLAAHDGFTLRDLTEYRVKYNFANGENNRDGKRDEITCLAVDLKALLATLLLSRGVPMLTAGDEFGRTQSGNNNAYAQDNEITWLDWQDSNSELSAWVGRLAALRRSQPLIDTFKFLSSKPEEGDVLAHWFGA
ncbi:MAG: glycogen debranching protein GlgX, partial [Alphaproteobacteria bacterium]|nr:glycogen debranching protein GlgX [Alphaproteobacteria bacterium]